MDILVAAGATPTAVVSSFAGITVDGILLLRTKSAISSIFRQAGDARGATVSIASA
jgi:hypothetical protein